MFYEIAIFLSPSIICSILLISFKKFYYWTRQYSFILEVPIKKPSVKVGRLISGISLCGVQDILIFYKFAGM